MRVSGSMAQRWGVVEEHGERGNPRLPRPAAPPCSSHLHLRQRGATTHAHRGATHAHHVCAGAGHRARALLSLLDDNPTFAWALISVGALVGLLAVAGIGVLMYLKCCRPPSSGSRVHPDTTNAGGPQQQEGQQKSAPPGPPSSPPVWGGAPGQQAPAAAAAQVCICRRLRRTHSRSGRPTLALTRALFAAAGRDKEPGAPHGTRRRASQG